MKKNKATLKKLIRERFKVVAELSNLNAHKSKLDTVILKLYEHLQLKAVDIDTQIVVRYQQNEYTTWDIDGLRVALSKKLSKVDVDEVIKARVTYSVDEDVMRTLITSKKITAKWAQKFITTTQSKPFIRVYENKGDND